MSPATVNGTVLEPVVASVAAGTSAVANGRVETVVIGSVVVVAAVAETVSVAVAVPFAGRSRRPVGHLDGVDV